MLLNESDQERRPDDRDNPLPFIFPPTNRHQNSAQRHRSAQLRTAEEVKRRIALAAVLVVSLALVWVLPLYVERTMTHVMFADGSGGAIEWGWKRCSLREYCADYRYMRREQTPAVWLAVDIALAISYASVVTVVFAFVTRRKF